jgi:hypothetical protein
MTTTLSPEERSARARQAAYAQHAQHDPTRTTAAAREALWAKYHAMADPRGELDETERHRRAKALLNRDLALRSLHAARLARERRDAALADELLAGGAS